MKLTQSRSEPQHRDPSSSMLRLSTRATLGDRRGLGSDVEEDQGSFGEAEALEIAADLLQPVLEGVRPSIPPDLQLGGPALEPSRVRPASGTGNEL